MANGDRKVRALNKKLQALQLRRAGFSYDIIAERLGYASRSGAYKAVMTALRETLKEPAEELRRLQLDRLDALLASIWNEARDGEKVAVSCVLKIMERMDKLRGLESPDKIEIRHKVDVAEMSDEELVSIIRGRE